MRFLWLLLTKVTLKFSRDLIIAAIMCRVVRRIVHEEIKIKSELTQSSSPLSIPQLNNASTKQSQENPSLGQYSAGFQGNQNGLFKESLALCVNALIKRKFSKQRPVFDEILLGLYLSRLKVIGLANSLSLLGHEINYLESKDIIEHIVEMPSRNPIMFLNSIQAYFNL